MTKRLIAKHAPGEVVPSGQPVSHLEDMALNAYWKDRANPYELSQVGRLLDLARTDNKWIACDCQDRNGVPAKNPPVLMIRRQDNGSLYLFRPNNRPEHQDDCVFRITQQELRARADKARASGEGIIDPGEPPQLLGPEKAAAAKAVGYQGVHSRIEKNVRQDSLFKVLAWLIETSGINRCGSTPGTAKGQWQALFDTARRTQVTNSMTFYDTLIVGAAKLQDDAYKSQFGAIAKKSPQNRTPVGYLLLTADQLTRTNSGGTVIGAHVWEQKPDGEGKVRRDLEVEIPCQVRYPARDGEQVKAPYLVLIKVTADARGFTRLSRGVAQPIAASNDLFPVDSDIERKAYAKLLATGAVHVGKGGYFALEKPVQGRRTPAGLCRPDFLVRRSDVPSVENTMIVETMGFSSEAYLQRKAVSQDRMRLLGSNLYQDIRTPEVQDRDANDKLYRSVMRWLIHGAGHCK